MADTTPTQALNELRRMLKSYEDLKRAEAVLTVLADAEAVAKSLQTQKDKVEKELAAVTVELQTAQAALGTATSELKYSKAKVNETLTDAQSYADSIVARANDAANEIRENAKAEAAAVQAAIVLAKRNLMELDASELTARNKHDTFVAHAAASKAQIIESLTSLGGH